MMKAQPMKETILEFKGVSKDFPGVRALDKVDFDLKKGEVHALVGENGAGKSTLIKILAGVYPPTEGDIYYKGGKITVRSPKEGIDLGVSVIYQEFNLVPYISVAKNIFMGREPHRKWLPFFIDYHRLYSDAKEILQSMSADIDPKTKVVDLGVAQKQLVEMAKAFSVKASILVMDEPTAALTDREIKELFRSIREFKKKGISIIYISHRLEEIFEIADRITILRDGKVVETMKADEVKDLDHIIKLMVGRSMTAYFSREFLKEKGEVALEVKDLSRKGLIQDVNLCVRSGEIVGLAGLVGSGRTELARAIFGVDPHETGEIYILGKKVSTNPAKSIALGLGFLPEDRKAEGLALILPVRENIMMASLRRVFPLGLINPRKESRLVNEYVRTLRIATPSILRIAKFLSGGNQQKVIVAKWLSTQAKIFIFDEPTRGIDVGAKAEIHQLMNELVKQGAAILMISSELHEVLNMSDRIYVMRGGRIIKELPREEANQEAILRYAMGGARREESESINA
jgi:ribose transport system ATP-binding protein